MRLLLQLLGIAALSAAPVAGGPGMVVVHTRGASVARVDATGHDATGAPLTAATPMRVASLSKSFTAAALLTLVDAGAVDLDRSVASYLPEFRLADPRASAVTVRQLLNQTSGLSDRTLDIDATQRAADLRAYVAALANGRLAAAPGTHYEYCNVNYDVAARLVEAVDGRPFAEAVRARVFTPLGMTHSAIAAPDRTPGPASGPAAGARPVDGYNSVFGIWVARPELPGFRGGAGGVVTTAADMGRWLVSQTGHGPRLLTDASLRAMHTPGPSAGRYAMGWGVERAAGRTLLVHAGNLFTYTAVQAIDPATGEGWAVLANSASLVDETYDALLAAVGGTVAPRGQRALVEGALGAVALVAVGLGASGVRRARRRRSAWRLLPPLLPVAVFVTGPQWISLLMNGRRVTWAQLTYFAAPLTITLGVAAIAGLATLAARLRWVGAPRAPASTARHAA